MSKRNNQDAAQQTRAANLVREMVERMRANSSSDGLGSYVLNSPHQAGPIAAEPNPNCRDPDQPCDAEQLALHDLWIWQQSLADTGERIEDEDENTGGLVDPVACITGPVGGSGLYTVALAWRGGTAIPDDPSVACGSGAVDAAGGGRLYGDHDEFRRTMVVPAYIAVR
jgi:hypothetical protein